MLKLEPREAANVCLPIEGLELRPPEEMMLKNAVYEMRRWRHCA
jgi:hypothetical protein